MACTGGVSRVDWSLVVNLLYEFTDSVAYLLLCALGLIIILGMMNIINLAQGELMMMGAYIATIAVGNGIPLPIAALLSFVGVGMIGIVMERLIIRRYYGRELGALVVTWAISVIVGQGALIVFGPSMPPIPIPLGSFAFGGFTYSAYRLVLIVVAGLLTFGLWALYNWTRFGLEARATMQNPVMARSLGINTDRVYMMTFGLGAALAGLSGAILAPLTYIAPLMGQQFVAPAFITVVIGGTSNVIGGALGSSTFLSMIQTPVGNFFGAYLGNIAMLFAALLVIRVLPQGMSGLFRSIADRRLRVRRVGKGEASL